MTEAKGPIFAAGFQSITKGGYPVLLLPDVNNDALQREGKPPVDHWLPNTVRLARKENGDYKFSFLHFVGVRDEETHVGTTGTEEVAGALVGFSTTSTPPPGVLEEVKEEQKALFRGSNDHFWGWRSEVEPDLRPAPIVSNTMSITDLAPGSDGAVPVIDQPGGGGASGPVAPRCRRPATGRSSSSRGISATRPIPATGWSIPATPPTRRSSSTRCGCWSRAASLPRARNGSAPGRMAVAMNRAGFAGGSNS